MTKAELIARLQELRTTGSPGSHAAGDARDEFWDLVSQNISTLVAMASNWNAVCATARDRRYSSEGIGIQVRNMIAEDAAEG